MKTTRSCAAAAVLVFLWMGTALAGTPDSTIRFFGVKVSPTSEFSGPLSIPGEGSVDATLEGSSGFGAGISWEWRTSDLIGVEWSFMLANVDFDLSAMGVSGSFGSALMMPTTLGVNFHPFKNETVDFYIGPVIGYTFWGNMDLELGDSIPMDGDFGVGGTVGLDLSLGSSSWAFSASARYLQTATGDSSLEVPVDPLLITVGFARQF